MKENIFKNLKKHIQSKTKLIVAVSGGVDSMALLDVIKDFSKPESVCVVTINHNIRKESLEDVKLVQKICKNYGILCKDYSIDWVDGEKQSEEVMRDKRYKILRKEKEIFQAQYILTAHHLDDRIETFLFRLIRGSGIRGLLSPKMIYKDLFRPLITSTKNEIIEYAEINHLKWNEDITNEDNIYARNIIRNTLLPIIQKLHPAGKSNIAQYVEDLEQWDRFHKSYLKKWLEKNPLPFCCDRFLELPAIIQYELLQELVKRYDINMTRGHMDEVIKITKSKLGNKQVTVTSNTIFLIKDKKLHLVNKDET